MSTSNNIHISAGFTLVELVVFISIVSIAVAGVVGSLSFVNRHSADPLVQKQALAIAEALAQEIQQVPFTYCDPNDANSGTATGYADCASNTQQSIVAPTPSGESRYNQANPLDNVGDYGGLQMPGGGCSGICRVGDSTALSGLNGYAATVALANVGGSAAFPGLAADAVVQVTITVTGPANTRAVVKEYRVRYVPRI